MKKRILSSILALMLIFTFIPGQVVGMEEENPILIEDLEEFTEETVYEDEAEESPNEGGSGNVILETSEEEFLPDSETEELQDEELFEESDIFEEVPEESEAELYRTGNWMEEKDTNLISYNQSYYFSDLKVDHIFSDWTYYLEMDFPEAGRAKILVTDCTNSCLESKWGHSYDSGLEEQEWSKQGAESYDSGWLSVKQGQFFFAIPRSGTINSEAQLQICYQREGEFVGELEDNDTYDTATELRLNTSYEGNCKAHGDIDLYRFTMEAPGLAEIQVKNGKGEADFNLYEEDFNGNITPIMNYAPAYYGTSRLRLAQGTYYIKVEPDCYAWNREYTVCANITYESSDAYEQEKNNIKSQANEKLTNLWYIGNLNDKKDIDNFKFVLDEKGYLDLEFRIPRQTPENKIKICLCDESLNVLETIVNTQNPYASTGEKLYPAGIYYVRVIAGTNYHSDEFDFYDDYSFCLDYRIVHSWDQTPTVDREATCTEEGSQSIHCSICDTIQEGSETVIPRAPHAWDAGNIISDSSCSAEGEITYTCESCGTLRTEIIPRKEHTWDAGVIIRESNCFQNGEKKFTCTVCGESKIETIDLVGHKFGVWQTVSEATVSRAKIQKHKCTVCGFTETRSVGTALRPTITVNVSKIFLKTGQSTTAFQVSGLASGDRIVSWKTSNKKIFTVTSSGKLTAGKKTGNATLTITLKSGLKKKIPVVVQKNAVRTSRITGLSKYLTLQKGRSFKLKPVIRPITSEEKITYTSSDKKIATVSTKGTIKAKKGGTAKITVKSGKKKFTVTVTVPKTETVRITGVKKAITLKKGKSYTLKARVKPADSDEEITYKSSNKKVATVDKKGKIKGIKKGTATIYVKSGKVTVKCKVSVK